MAKLSPLLILAASLAMLLACSGNEEAETQRSETPVQQEQQQSQPEAAINESAAKSEVGDADEQSLVGTWGYRMGKSEMRVTYRPDGAFVSETVIGGARLQLHGAYEFDGRMLVSRPREFTTSDTMQEASEKVRLLNERIKQDPQAVVEVSTIIFVDANRFTATDENGVDLLCVRMKE